MRRQHGSLCNMHRSLCHNWLSTRGGDSNHQICLMGLGGEELRGNATMATNTDTRAYPACCRQRTINHHHQRPILPFGNSPTPLSVGSRFAESFNPTTPDAREQAWHGGKDKTQSQQSVWQAVPRALRGRPQKGLGSPSELPHAEIWVS